MAKMADRLRTEVEKAKKAQASREAVARMGSNNTQTSELAKAIAARKAQGSINK